MRRLGLSLAVLLALGAGLYALSAGSGRDGEAPAPPVPAADGTAAMEPARLRGEAAADPGRPAGDRIVRGHVLDPEGRAAPDVRVEIARRLRWRAAPRLVADREPGRPVSEPLASTRSDAEGAFVLEGLPSESDARLRLTAVPEPPAVGSTVLLREGDWQTMEVGLQIAPGTRLALRVVDAGDHGVRARIQASATGAFGRSSPRPGVWSPEPAWTNEDGRRVLPAVPVGLLRVSVLVPDRIEVRGLGVPTPFEGEYVIRLPGGATGCRVEGRVTNAADEPVAEARITATVVFPPGSDISEVSLQGTSDAEGRYAFDGLVSGRLEQLRVEADGYLPRAFESLAWTLDPESALPFDVRLTRGGEVVGRVLDPEGRGIAGATVELFERGRDPLVAACNGEGRYRLEGVPTGEHVLVPSAAGYYAEAGARGFGDSRRDRRLRTNPGGALVLLAEDGGSVQHDFTLQPGIPVAGVVLDEAGTPVSGARVQVSGRPSVSDLAGAFAVTYGGIRTETTTTDADGRFAFAGLRPGGPSAFVEARKDGLVTEAQELRLQEDDVEALRSLELRAYACATLGGVVLDPADEPVNRALVFMSPGTNVQTDGSGRFRITGLRAGTYTLRVNGRRQGPEVARTVSRGEVVDDVVLRAPVLFAVQGTLVDEDDAPLAYLPIRVESEGEDRFQIRTVTDAQGAFLAEGLPEGTYRVRTDDGAVTTSVPAGATGVRLVRPRASQAATHLLHGKVRAPDGRPVAGGKVSVNFASDDRPGATTGRSGAILNGRFRLEIRTNAQTVSLFVHDAVDVLGRPILHEPLRLEDLPIGGSPFLIELSGPGRLAGRVVDEVGSGLAGVGVTAHHGPRRGRSERSRREDFRRTQADGSFRFDELCQGPVQLTVQVPPGYVPIDPLHAQTGDEIVVVRLERGAVITGRVVDEHGEPLADVPLQAMPATHPVGHWGNTRSAKDGSFVLAGLDRDTTYTVRTDFDRDGKYPDLVRCEVPNLSPGASDVLVVARLGTFLEGVVVFPDGSPAYRCFVTAQPVDGASGVENQGSAFLDSPDGRFRIGPMVPGRYRVVARPPSAEFGPSEPIDADVPAESLRLALTSQRTRRGRVLAEGLSGFQVAAVGRKEERGSHVVFRGAVAEDGAFVLALPGDEPLTIVVYGHADDRYALVHDVAPTGDLLEVPLVTGLSIEGRLDPLPEDRRRMGLVYAESVTYAFRTMATVDERGHFRLRGLPPGDYDLTLLTGPPRGEPKRTTVAAGATGVVLEVPAESR